MCLTFCSCVEEVGEFGDKKKARLPDNWQPRGISATPATSYSPTTRMIAVPSAMRSLTTVFGMGTGVASSPWSPGIITVTHKDRKKIRRRRDKGKEPQSRNDWDGYMQEHNMVKPHG